MIYIKESSKKDFVILDVAMNDFMRPALYNAIHKIIPVKKSIKKSKKIMNSLVRFVKAQINLHFLKISKNLKKKI